MNPVPFVITGVAVAAVPPLRRRVVPVSSAAISGLIGVAGATVSGVLAVVGSAVVAVSDVGEAIIHSDSPASS